MIVADLETAIELLKKDQDFILFIDEPTVGADQKNHPITKAVAKESEANFIQVKGPSLLSMWVGESLPYNEEVIVKERGIVKRMKIGDIVEKKLNA